MAYLEQTEKNYLLKVKAIPQSKKNAIIGKWNDLVKIAITATAEKGEANKTLIKFLSKEFKIKQSEIKIISGETSHIKTISLPLSAKIEI